MKTVDAIADSFVKLALTLEKVDAVKKWEWARELSSLLDSLADDGARTKTSEEIGRKIGEGLGRNPYSGAWVRMHAAAYRKFPNGLATQEDYRAFLAAANGNAARAAKRSAVSPTNSNASPAPADDDSDDVQGTDDGGTAPAAPANPLDKIKADVKAARAAGIAEKDILTAVKEALR